MRFSWSNDLVTVASVYLILAILSLVLVAVAPLLPFLPSSQIQSIAPLVSFGLIVASTVVFQIYIFLNVIEIATSNNETSWKLIWGAICLLGGVVGIILYNFIAKKDLK